MTIVERRGEYIALTGLILQGVLFRVLLVRNMSCINCIVGALFYIYDFCSRKRSLS